MSDARRETRSHDVRRAWWAGLSEADRAAYLGRVKERKAAERQARPSREWCEAVARLDVAEREGIFMREVPVAEMEQRWRDAYPACVRYITNSYQ